jgi:uncharacterized protein YndB with AHSA1/START domain
METQDIHQHLHIKASPKEIYDAIVDPDKHAAFTGAPATMDPKVGGDYSAHGGYITGKNLELVPGKKIVQSWNAQEDNWPADYFSKITYDLKEENGGTTLNFTHEGVPEENVESITDGWITYYWEPLKEMMEGK